MKKNNLLTVSEVAKILNVNKETILHYDREGLVHSIRMNNNYRYYREFQVEIFKMILNLRKMGFSVKEIKEMKNFFETEDYNTVMEMIKKREKEFEEERQALEREKKALISHKNWLEFLMSSAEINGTKPELKEDRIEKKVFCIKTLKKEKAIFISLDDIDYPKEIFLEQIYEKLKIYNFDKDWYKKFLFGYVISKKCSQDKKYEKLKLIIKTEIELYPDKYVFQNGEYAIYYIPFDEVDEEKAVEDFYSKINENGYKAAGDLYMEDLFMFGKPETRRFKTKILKTLVKPL